MKAPPSFQFYGADFDVSTRHWSLAEVGAYIRLLIHQWECGSVPDDERGLMRLLGALPDEFEEVWPTVSEKFPVAECGARKNPRLESVREEQLRYRRERAEAGRRGGISKARNFSSSATGSARAQPVAQLWQKPSTPTPTPTPTPTYSPISQEKGKYVFGPDPNTTAPELENGKKAQERAEISWRIERVWEVHLGQREMFFRDDAGIKSRPPKLTKQIRDLIRDALHRHDQDLLGAEQREEWEKLSYTRAAGVGIFLDDFMVGRHKDNDIRDGGRRYLEPDRPWRIPRGKPDPVPRFADRYFEAKGGVES